jgi:hypothetical protein
MKQALEQIEALHGALITALDANDLGGIERSSRGLDEALAAAKGRDVWPADPELKLAAERVGRLAQAAMMRVNILNDQARRRSEALAAVLGRPAPVTYSR